jgi:hypothetical protein
LHKTSIYAQNTAPQDWSQLFVPYAA